MDNTELQEILHLHKLWCWKKKGGKRACLPEANLKGASLEGANLFKANLQGAFLIYTNLEGANLKGANLEGAYLYGANLSGANLQGANLFKANLSGANLQGANLFKANLQGANLSYTNLEGANLKDTILDPEAPVPSPAARQCLGAGFEIKEVDGRDQVWGWRTKVSQVVGTTEYVPGEYIAPYFSVDTETECHPGIYLASKEWLEWKYRGCYLVRCWCWRNEMIQVGDKFRAKRIFVVEHEDNLVA